MKNGSLNMSYSLSKGHSLRSVQRKQRPAQDKRPPYRILTKVRTHKDSLVRKKRAEVGIEVFENGPACERSTSLEETRSVERKQSKDYRPVLDRLRELLGSKQNSVKGLTNIPTYFLYSPLVFLECKGKNSKTIEELAGELSYKQLEQLIQNKEKAERTYRISKCSAKLNLSSTLTRYTAELQAAASSLEGSTQASNLVFSEGAECFSISMSLNSVPTRPSPLPTSNFVLELSSDEICHIEAEIFPEPSRAFCRRLGFFLI